MRATDRTNRVEETHGATVTREKCFMATLTCYYNSDGTVTTSFTPTTTNALVEEDTSQLTFDLIPTDCDTDADLSGPATVFVDERVCYRGLIETNWHVDLRASLRTCWASESADPAVMTNAYLLADRDGVDTSDSTFSWDCYPLTGSATRYYSEFFSFDAFRFQPALEADQNDVNTYVQTMYIHCEINACEQDDSTSDHCETENACLIDLGIPIARKRREAQQPMSLAGLTKTQLSGKVFVLPRRETSVNFVEPSSYNIFSDTLSLGMFAVGCVLGVVVIGLVAVLRRTQNQVRYGALPNGAHLKA
jgi:hypothetical protein